MRAAEKSWGATAPDRFWYDVATEMRDHGRKIELENAYFISEIKRVMALFLDHSKLFDQAIAARVVAEQRAEKAEAEAAVQRTARRDMDRVCTSWIERAERLAEELDRQRGYWQRLLPDALAHEAITKIDTATL